MKELQALRVVNVHYENKLRYLLPVSVTVAVARVSGGFHGLAFQIQEHSFQQNNDTKFAAFWWLICLSLPFLVFSVIHAHPSVMLLASIRWSMFFSSHKHFDVVHCGNQSSQVAPNYYSASSI